MRLGIVGGKLQGTEAAYLARKAGLETVLYDRKTEPTALHLCDSFYMVDLLQEDNLDHVFNNVDLVLPALEDDQVLERLVHWSGQSGRPLAFDPASYAVTSSKILSNRLFDAIGVPQPLPWPDCRFPVIAKGSKGSGSDNVHRVDSSDELDRLLSSSSIEWVVQEWVDGPSYSLEVIGNGTGGYTYQVTALEMDAGFDCKRVYAPAGLDPEAVMQFEEVTLAICSSLKLKGIMDVEVILTGDGVKVLEIDARLPSQTPTVVLLSSGVNLLEELVAAYLQPGKPVPGQWRGGEKGAIYEHLRVSPGLIEVCGEHIMSGAGPLSLLTGFYGADEALTSYKPGRGSWVATMIYTGSSLDEARLKREEVIREIIKGQSGGQFIDPYPVSIE